MLCRRSSTNPGWSRRRLFLSRPTKQLECSSPVSPSVIMNVVDVLVGLFSTAFHFLSRFLCYTAAQPVRWTRSAIPLRQTRRLRCGHHLHLRRRHHHCRGRPRPHVDREDEAANVPAEEAGPICLHASTAESLYHLFPANNQLFSYMFPLRCSYHRPGSTRCTGRSTR